MTSPLLEWTYPKRLIRLNTVEPETELGQGLKDEVAYRILVPVANVDTQKGLIQLATAIALNNSQSSVVHPLSLVELEEDYAFQSMPAEADRLTCDSAVEAAMQASWRHRSRPA